MGEQWPVLTIRNPWCWAIVHGGKRIENRSWNTAYRGPLWLHAGARSRRETAREILNLHAIDRKCTRNVGPYGHMEVSLNKISRGEPLPDWRDLRGGEGAEHG